MFVAAKGSEFDHTLVSRLDVHWRVYRLSGSVLVQTTVIALPVA